MTGVPEPDDEELFRFLLGELPPERAAELESWRRGTEARQARLNELASLISALQQPVPGVDLVPAIDARIARARRPRRPRTWVAALAAIAAVAALVVVAQRSEDPAEEELRRKGSGSKRAEPVAEVHAYRLEAGGVPTPLSAELGVGDSLLFAYSNGGAVPFTHLLIFGVGQTGQVYWYFPAWLNAGDDPTAIAIEPAELIEMHERISHPLPPGRFVLHAVFARRALRVSEVEQLMGRADAGADAPLPLPDTAQRRYVVEVR
ncbi:MAG: hypothetical protein Q8L48_27765 [Archangium sp.]|nr:hypothetical protein [Archangium sp.]